MIVQDLLPHNTWAGDWGQVILSCPGCQHWQVDFYFGSVPEFVIEDVLREHMRECSVFERMVRRVLHTKAVPL